MDSSKNNIALVGFMGTGKTTVGRLLAAKSGLAFIDIDECISAKAGMDIPLIFSTFGESYFRDLEEEVLREILINKNQVISCGGGIVAKEINRSQLIKNSVICWLYNSLETSLSRINETSRPLLNASDPVGKARDLFMEREALYREVAHFSICTEDIDQYQVADIIYNDIFLQIFAKR